jgi:dTDP-4-amino-4,6-dideoxygalactose transaminase
VATVMNHGKYILGPEVEALEERLSDYWGIRHAVTCSSGTDALVLALKAIGVGRDDVVLVPSFTFVASAEAVVLTGAVPMFVDVLPGTFCIDVRSVEAALAVLADEGNEARAVISVDLFGQPCDYGALRAVCDRWSLALVVDASQAFGAHWSATPVSRLGDVVATSFFPSKPLGCYGDGGAIFTDDVHIAETLRSLRIHGRARDGEDGVRIGLNGRLDTVQAAILLEKLAVFDDELVARRRAADRYEGLLDGLVVVPVVAPAASSVWAHYTVLLHEARDELRCRLHDRGIQTGVYYPAPVHTQPAYRAFRRAPGGLPIAEELSRRVLSLPMHPYLDEPTQDRVVGELRHALASLVS